MSNHLKIVTYAEKIQRALIASKEFDSDLCGACAIGSKELFKFGLRNNIPIKICGVYNKYCSHFFNIYNDTVYDITACQFSDRYKYQIAIVKLTSAIGFWYWNPIIKICKNKELKKAGKNFIKFQNWGNQNPNIYKFSSLDDGELRLDKMVNFGSPFSDNGFFS
ncbi:MAG TPA: hypothetical protein PLP33_25195 [Leptospiraceae bacterium]|nr:hypothetical protein [Leptospiraceae bacterium]